MNNRVYDIRHALDMTMEEFGNRLGVTRSAISNIESNRRKLTDQMIFSICREFNVDENWLRTGSGEMFRKSNESDLMKMIDRILSGENEFHKNLFKTFAQLDEKELSALESILDRFLKVQDSDTGTLFSASDIPDTPEELERLYPPINLGKDNAV